MQTLVEKLRVASSNLNRGGMYYQEGLKRAALFPYVLQYAVKEEDKDEVLKGVISLLKDSVQSNIDLLDYLILIFQGEREYKFIQKFSYEFKEAVEYLIEGSACLNVPEEIVNSVEKVSKERYKQYLNSLLELE